MRIDSRLALLASALTCFSAAHAAPAPVEAYAQRPAMVDVDLNPAGTRLAWIEDTGKSARLIIHDLSTHKDLRTLNAPATLTLHSIYWASDDTVLLNESHTDTLDPAGRDVFEVQRWVAVDALGGADRTLLMNGGDRNLVTGATLVRRYTERPGKVFMSTLDFSEIGYKQETGSRLTGGRKDSGWSSNLYEVDLKSGDGKVIESGTPYTTDWEIDARGERVVRADYNPKYNQYDLVVKDGAGWRGLYRGKDCGQLDLVGFTADNSAALATGVMCGEDHHKLIALPLDGTPLHVVAEDPAQDMQGLVRDPYDGKVLAALFAGGDTATRWLDPQGEKRTSGLHRTFANSTIIVVSRSSNYRRVVVRAESDEHPPIYFLVDYDAKTADIINEEYPQLNGVKLGAVREFHYAARDKYSLLAYLTVPPGAAEKNLPLIVMPHGGPEAHDSAGFDWLAQFLASRGYAVLQPQFRGSSGFGRAHADAGRRQWGLRMQDDVTDAARAAIDQGIADPKRVCIVGWSYGGYAALAGAAFTPELYACVASIAGVSDLPAMLGYTAKSNGRESDSVAYWKDHIGPATDPQVIAKSPARSATTVRAPILLLHGTDDTIVPIAQSRLMAHALDSAKKEYEFVELPGDDHQLHSSVTRVKMATELERFLAKHLGAAPNTPTGAVN